MADEFDLASDREQLAREAAIANLQAKTPAAVATGFCLECGLPLPHSHRWCDNFCRDDWQRWNPGS